MKSDISLPIDGIYLNIRVGIIFKYQDKVLIEIRKDRVGNSVIPGGRVKIDEYRIEALKREIKEEMNYDLLDDRIIYKDTIESFFTINDKDVHELFFIYEYLMDEKIYEGLLTIKENRDNHMTDYIFVGYDEFEKVDLLPMDLRDIIKSN